VAAPIVRKALDYYLLGKRPNEKDAVQVPRPDADLRPAGEPRPEPADDQKPNESPGNTE